LPSIFTFSVARAVVSSRAGSRCSGAPRQHLPVVVGRVALHEVAGGRDELVAALSENDPSRVYRAPRPGRRRTRRRRSPCRRLAGRLDRAGREVLLDRRDHRASPRWLGFVPPKSSLGGAPPASVT
jgi:hypothetical protein